MTKRFICIAPIGYGTVEVPDPEAIAKIVYDSWNEGASIVHLHPVDSHGNITSDVSAFKETVGLIKKKCDIIIQGSTGGLSNLSIEERSLSVGIDGVEQGSLNMGSANLFGSVFENNESDIRYIAKKMLNYNVKPELEIFNEPMIDLALELRDEGLLPDPLFFQVFVLNKENSSDYGDRKIGKIQQKIRRIIAELESMRSDCEVSICNHGNKDLNFLGLALSLGLNIRVGFEDSRHIAPDRISRSNAELVQEAVKIMGSFGIEPTSPNETRTILKMTKKAS